MLLPGSDIDLRPSSQQCDMVAVARTFRDVLDGRRNAADGSAMLAEIYPGASFANGFIHGLAGARRVS